MTIIRQCCTNIDNIVNNVITSVFPSNPATNVPSNSVVIHSVDKTNMIEENEIKDAIENNNPIENKLHVISVISNPCLFKRRYELMKQFIQRMEFENNLILYIVELAYKNQKFEITSDKNPRHLQLRTEHPIWHKENMINLGVQYLLPSDWKAFAWIDADIDFDNNNWAIDTLKILNGCKDIVQIFSHIVDMDKNNQTMNVYNSFSFQYSKNLPYSNKFPNYWHPGFAWACTRKAYEKMGKLFELCVLGSGDHIMTFCFVHKAKDCIHEKDSVNLKNEIAIFQEKVKRLRLGYVPGLIRHFFHGSKENRKYVERNQILYKYQFDPLLQFQYDSKGLLIPTDKCSKYFLNEIMDYFKVRNEDE